MSILLKRLITMNLASIRLVIKRFSRICFLPSW